MLAVTADHYIKVSRFGYIVEIIVVEVQQFRGDFERDRLTLTCFEEDFFEAFQLFHRAGNASAPSRLPVLVTVTTAVTEPSWSIAGALKVMSPYWNVVYDKP